GPGAGYTINCGMPGGGTDADYGAFFQDLFLPVAEAYKPDLVLVSAGFDAHRKDPIGGMVLTERRFAAMSTALQLLAESACEGRVVMRLEGGSSLEGLYQSVHACVEVMAEDMKDSFPEGVSREAAAALQRSREALEPYWRVLGR